jgi:hypothetical protein
MLARYVRAFPNATTIIAAQASDPITDAQNASQFTSGILT